MKTDTIKNRGITGLRGAYRDLLKHSVIYGLGQILSRVASFLLLPIYTNYLPPANYGVIAILDLTSGVLGILIGSGMGAAVTRYHFQTKNEVERDQVWWTGLTFVVLMATVVVVPAWLSRDVLARLTLGSNVEGGSFYYTLVLATLWFGTIGQLPDEYLRVRKWSVVSVSVNLARLVLNVGINVYFLAVLHLGITGVLIGNLITGGVTTLALLVIFACSRGPYTYHRPLVRRLWQFGGPLVITALLSTIMHQADRYLLRLFVDMDQVGIYSLAYTIGQAVNSLCLLPFASIWSVVVYETAHLPNAEYVYTRIFQYFVYGMALIMLGVSLFARQLLTVMVDPEYLQAADLIPIVCLAYLFFSLHEHFKVPAMLAKRTEMIPGVVGVAAATNIGANLLLIPLLGPAGAAWASVVTFATYSFVGLWRYRTIDRYEYPLSRCGVVLAGMVISYLCFRLLSILISSYIQLMIISSVIYIGWIYIICDNIIKIIIKEKNFYFR